MRIPQGRSIGPFSSSTPRLFSSSDHCIHVVYTERELEPDTRVGSGDRGRRDKRGRFARLQQVDERVAELEDGRVVVFEEDWELKDVS